MQVADRQPDPPRVHAGGERRRRGGVQAGQVQGVGHEAGPGGAPYATLGMAQTLNRLTPFFATLLDQLRRHYGLDLDASLRGLQATLLQQTGDRARLRLRYELAGRPIDAVEWLRDGLYRVRAGTCSAEVEVISKPREDPGPQPFEVVVGEPVCRQD